MTDTARTAQELADARKRISARPRRYSEDVNECVAFAAGFEEGVIAALASQAEPVAEWVRSPVGDFPQLVWERGYEARIGDKLYTTPPAPAQAEPTMADALAAGDGTLHGAIDYWQRRASEDGRDAERLDFMIESDAFVVWSFPGDGSIKQCQLWSQDEDEEYHIISGERYFNTPREAIDAAIAAKEQS